MSNHEKATVLLFEPGKYPKTVTIDAIPSGLCKAVGGEFDVIYPFGNDICVVCRVGTEVASLQTNRALRSADKRSEMTYAVNPEKTSGESREETAALHAIDNVVEYTADDMKTERRMYVSGVNCQVRYAREQFMETKRRFGKLDGRTCYHGYQSFRAGEVDADPPAG